MSAETAATPIGASPAGSELDQIKAQILALQDTIQKQAETAAENTALRAQVEALQAAATRRLLRQGQVVDGENPYPALKAHLRAAKHEKTYLADTTGATICSDCGTIVKDPRKYYVDENDQPYAEEYLPVK